MNSVSSPVTSFSPALPAHPGTVLRFVDAFPTAAAAAKRTPKARPARRKKAPPVEPPGGVLLMRL